MKRFFPLIVMTIVVLLLMWHKAVASDEEDAGVMRGHKEECIQIAKSLNLPDILFEDRRGQTIDNDWVCQIYKKGDKSYPPLGATFHLEELRPISRYLYIKHDMDVK